MAKKGKALEILVGKIQEVLKDKSDTSIEVGVHLTDKEGISREFDVLVQVVNQGMPSTIVFECKDYSTSAKQTKVDIKIVDALIGKCADLPEIHQKVIVSTTGFSDNAKIKAKANGIRLCSLDEIPMEEVFTTYKVFVPNPKYSVVNNAVYNIDHPQNIDILQEIESPNLYLENGDTMFYIELEVLKHLYELEVRGKLAKVFMEGGQKPFERIVKISFDDQVYIKGRNGVKYPVRSVNVPVLIDFDIEEGEVVKQQKYHQGKDVTITEFQFKNNNYPFGTIIIEDGENSKALFNINNQLETPHMHLQ